MKCLEHGNEATAICANCYAGLCMHCAIRSESGKHCCSEVCVANISSLEEVLRLTLDRTTGASKSTAYGAYYLGILFLGFSVFGLFKNYWTFAVYAGLFGLGIIGMGHMFYRTASAKVAVKNKLPPTVDASTKQRS